jgi:hypothetical protein
MRLGSVAEGVVRQAPGSVCTLRPEALQFTLPDHRGRGVAPVSRTRGNVHSGGTTWIQKPRLTSPSNKALSQKPAHPGCKKDVVQLPPAILANGRKGTFLAIQNQSQRRSNQGKEAERQPLIRRMATVHEETGFQERQLFHPYYVVHLR